MDFIAKHHYIKAERKVSLKGLDVVEDNRWIYLYPDKVVTKHRVFPIEDVTDFSYRMQGSSGGILYLHHFED